MKGLRSRSSSSAGEGGVIVSQGSESKTAGMTKWKRTLLTGCACQPMQRHWSQYAERSSRTRSTYTRSGTSCDPQRSLATRSAMLILGEGRPFHAAVNSSMKADTLFRKDPTKAGIGLAKHSAGALCRLLGPAPSAMCAAQQQWRCWPPAAYALLLSVQAAACLCADTALPLCGDPFPPARGWQARDHASRQPHTSTGKLRDAGAAVG
mmetsp:Transcript_18313/g.46916  ORF Transcript_18313/g.46916 Transcript_18313/m.46916 type:complete len:208 (+) Transcript_18313:703-1326(+)